MKETGVVNRNLESALSKRGYSDLLMPTDAIKRWKVESPV
jgi:hypothetical protein